MRRLIIHAGLPKTGTTAIQQFMCSNELALRDQGVFYSPTGRKRNHNPLALAFWDHPQRTYAKRYGDDVARMHRDSLAAWRLLLDRFDDSGHEVLLVSGEHFSRASVDAMKEFVGTHLPGFEIRTYFYLRRPSAHYVSLLQQRIKGSNRLKPIGRWQFQRARTHARWRELGDVVLREFDRRSLVDGNAALDFAAQIGLDVTGMTTAPVVNESVSAEGMALVLAHRRLHFPDATARILPKSKTLLERIRRRELELGGAAVFTTPRLHRPLADDLDSDVEEAARLKELFGFEFRGAPRGSEVVASRPPIEDGTRFDDLDELITIDRSALALLRNSLEEDGYSFS